MRLLVGRAGPPRCRLSIAPPACEKSETGSHRLGRPCPGSHPTEFPASEDGLLLATSVLRVSLVTRPRLGKDARKSVHEHLQLHPCSRDAWRGGPTSAASRPSPGPQALAPVDCASLGSEMQEPQLRDQSQATGAWLRTKPVGDV